MPESPDENANDSSAYSSHTDDRRISLRDEGIRNTQQQTEAEADRPARPRQTGRADHKSNPKPCNESCWDCSLLVGEAHRQHNSDVYSAEHQTTDDPQHDSGHRSPFCHCRFKGVVNQLMHPMSRRDLRWRLILADVKSTLFTHNEKGQDQPQSSGWPKGGLALMGICRVARTKS